MAHRFLASCSRELSSALFTDVAVPFHGEPLSVVSLAMIGKKIGALPISHKDNIKELHQRKRHSMSPHSLTPQSVMQRMKAEVNSLRLLASSQVMSTTVGNAKSPHDSEMDEQTATSLSVEISAQEVESAMEAMSHGAASTSCDDAHSVHVITHEQEHSFPRGIVI